MRTACRTSVFCVVTLAVAPALAIAQQAGDVELETKTLTLSGHEVKVDAGKLWVPEYRADPDSPLIRIAFARLRSLAAEPVAPVIYLAGGPGGSSTSVADNAQRAAWWLPYVEIADVIFVDQRGAGRSERSLRYSAASIPKDAFVSREAVLTQFLETARAAAEHFRSQGVRLEGYTSNEAADDLNDLRSALGYDTMSLFGFSYGTHLAQAAIRRHEAHIESVVLSGVEGLDETHKLPLNMDVQFEKLARMVADDPVIGPHIPDLVALHERVIAKLEREPMIVQLRNRQIPVGPWGLNLILRFDIGDASDLPVFPRLLHSIDQGDPSVLTWFVRKRALIFTGVNLMSVFTDGASGASPERWATIRAQAEASRFGDVMVTPWPWADSAAGVVDLGPEYRAPLVSDVRALLLSGSLDWNTPPYQAERLRWGMRNATHIIVENAGHEQVLPQPQVQQAIIRFLRGEDVSDVRVALPPLEFVPLEGYDPAVTHPAVRR